MGFDHSRVPGLAGTGFIMAGDNNGAVVITAKHVLTEGMLNIQRPIPRHAPSALFVPDSSKKPILSEEIFRAFWMGSESADALYTRHFSYHDNQDVACCMVEPQDSYKNSFKPISIPLDTYRPNIGEVVHIVSQNAMGISDWSPPTGVKGIGQKYTINRKVSIRRGVVTGIYPQGFRQYPWQCFTTSIPVEPGMSGGFVYVPRDGDPISACGIVCADNSPEDARTDYLKCGESVIACAWAALSLRLPTYYSNDAPMTTLLAAMKNGDVLPAIGGLEGIEIVDHGNGSGHIKRSS
ncbi:MAG: trypsin-like peptidase domain-containing protein [Methylotenera sp.]|nr:trypsin-like peptidase domain-containing protein [Methylotenera sp.]